MKKTSLIVTIFVAILISFLGVYLTDFSNKYSVYATSLLLNGIGESEAELEAMNVHIFADNLKYEE